MNKNIRTKKIIRELNQSRKDIRKGKGKVLKSLADLRFKKMVDGFMDEHKDVFKELSNR